MFQMHYALVAERSILFTRQFGVQTPPDTLAAIERLSAMVPQHGTMNEIVDLAHLDGSDFDFVSMQRLVGRTERASRHAPQRIRIGIHAPDDIAYGLSRMHMSLLNMAESRAESRVFRTEEDVLRYMLRPESRFADLEGIDRLIPLPASL